jgi:spore coat protein H
MKHATYQGIYLLLLGGMLQSGCEGDKGGFAPGNGTDTTDTETGDSDDTDGSDTESSQSEWGDFTKIFNDEAADEAHDFFTPKKVSEIRLTLPADVWEQLIIDAEDEAYVPAEIVVDGEDIGEVGLRFKGSYGSLKSCFEEGELICDKLPMKIKFNKYDKEKRFKGLKRLNLHAGRWEMSMMNEYFAYKLFREMEIPTSRCGFADVYVNDELLGIYSMVEQIDGRFTDSRFAGGDGNLYKEVQLDDTEDALDESLRTNEDVADHTVYRAYAEEMSAAGDETLTGVVSKWMNMEYLMRYMAVDDTIFNWDGITAFYCGESWGCANHNFYLYQEEERPRFWLIPWDMSAVFDEYNWLDLPPWNDLTVDCYTSLEKDSSDTDVRPACGDPLLRALALYQRESSLYAEALRYLLDEVFDVDAFNAEIDEISEVLAPHIEADPDRTVSRWRSSVRTLKLNLEWAFTTAEDRFLREEILFDVTK